MRTLFLDTSGSYATVCVTENTELLSASTIRGLPAARIHAQIGLILKAAEITLADITNIAVVVGPGSWTGLNIGVTAAKTLAQILETGILPLSSLDSLVAEQAWGFECTCAFLNAGRGRAYRNWYDHADPLAGSIESGVVTITDLATEISQSEAPPLLIEYGNAIGASLGADAPVQQVQRLKPEGLMQAAVGVTPLTPDEALSLTPAYMQATMAERDAKPSW